MTKRLINYRDAALKRQNGLCYYCRQPMWTGDIETFRRLFGMSCNRASWHKVTAEHLQARRDGGTDKSNNIVAACRFCNTHRHRTNKPLKPRQFMVKVRRRLARGRWHRFIAGAVPV